MDIELRSYLAERFEGLERTFQLTISPMQMKQEQLEVDVKELDDKHDDVDRRLVVQEDFRDTHEKVHNEARKDRRFQWELLVTGLGIIMTLLLRG